MPISTTARRQNDPDKYIRRVKGGRYQARPYDEGVRESIGLFGTIGDARRAIREYWWGRVKPHLRFTRKVYSARGVFYIAMVRVPSVGGPQPLVRAGKAPPPGLRYVNVRIGHRYATAEEAYKEAVRWVWENLGPLVAFAMMTEVG